MPWTTTSVCEPPWARVAAATLRGLTGPTPGRRATANTSRRKRVGLERHDSTLAVELDDGDVRVVRRTNTKTVTTIKSRPPRTASVFLDEVSTVSWHKFVKDLLAPDKS